MKNERQTKINEQIDEAKRVIKKYNYNDIALITSTKLRRRAKYESFGFRFMSNDNYKAGDTINNYDGSISKIEVLIKPLNELI